jgi:hypothetical protein
MVTLFNIIGDGTAARRQLPPCQGSMRQRKGLGGDLVACQFAGHVQVGEE